MFLFMQADTISPLLKTRNCAIITESIRMPSLITITNILTSFLVFTELVCCKVRAGLVNHSVVSSDLQALKDPINAPQASSRFKIVIDYFHNLKTNISNTSSLLKMVKKLFSTKKFDSHSLRLLIYFSLSPGKGR